MSSEKKIGFFGGTFDPIHFGHIHLAVQMLEKHQLDEVLFSPANFSPLKSEDRPKADAFHRLAMVELAIEGIKGFSVYDGEIKRNGISYTVNTLRTLVQEAQASSVNKKFYLILGEDAIPHLHLWKDAEELFQMAPPLIGTRTGAPASLSSLLSPSLAQICREGMTKMPVLEISSTEIRERLKKRLYTGHLVPSKVLDYIYVNGLYYL